MRKEKKILVPNIKCQCGYSNLKKWIDIYGTCKLCGAILDNKAKYRYEMRKKLYLYPGTKRRFNPSTCKDGE